MKVQKQSSTLHSVEQDIDPIEAMEAMVEAIKVQEMVFRRGSFLRSSSAQPMSCKGHPDNRAVNQKAGDEAPNPWGGANRNRFGDIHTIGKSMVTTLYQQKGSRFMIWDQCPQ